MVARFSEPGVYNNGEFHDGTAQSRYVRASSDIARVGNDDGRRDSNVER